MLQLRIHAGPHHRKFVPVAVDLGENAPTGAWTLTRASDQQALPAQLDGSVLHFIAEDLPSGNNRLYRLESQARRRPDMVSLRYREKAGIVKAKIGGRKFLNYYANLIDQPRPFVFPLIGPRRTVMVRGHEPVAVADKVDVDTAQTELEISRSLWIGFGGVDGVDHWSVGPQTGRQVSRRVEVTPAAAAWAELRHEIEWQVKEQTQIRETRHLRIYQTPEYARLLDLTSELRAVERLVPLHGPGPLGMTLAESLLDPRHVTRLNGHGSVGVEEIHNERAPWCAVSGPAGGSKAGLAVFDHPANPRFPHRWQVDEQGYMAATPADGTVTVEAGEPLVWRFRILLFGRDLHRADLSERYQDWVHPPVVEIVG